ncbi:hypothetical protein [Microbacterium oxydans]|nr:hypothetical protein [Microbacterium oxydans]
MRIYDFFREEVTTEEGWTSRTVDLDLGLLRGLRRGPSSEHPDEEVGLALTLLARREFTAYGTDSVLAITDEGSRDLMRTLAAVARRLGVDEFMPPFIDFPAFRTYWTQHDRYGSWQARRDMIVTWFEPLQEQLEAREDSALAGELVAPVTPAQRMGWPSVDTEVQELRRHFHTARTVQDYRNIGNDCVAVLEALSATVYDAALHLREGEIEPAVAQTKQRLERYADVAFPGPGNEQMRALVKKTIEFAQAVKHNPNGTRVRAGIAADAVIQLANILRRIADNA